MRILQVIHQFPPHSSQGSEVYCFNLARRLNASEEVRVFHISNAPRSFSRALLRQTYAGLGIYHCIDWSEYARLADWPNEMLRRSFQTTLDELRPAVVHFHNYLSLGDDLVSLAKAHGAAVVYTLHDFGLICPNTLLLRDDGKLCGKNDADFFQDCCPMLIRTRGDAEDSPPRRARWPSLARWHLFSRQHPRPLIRSLLRATIGQADKWIGHPSHTHVERKRDFFQAQTRRIFRDADLFLAPSRFLLERYVSCGAPADKIAYLRYGMRHFAKPARNADRYGAASSLRFGYIGALHPQKGIELLLEAFHGLGERAELHVYGSVFGSPISSGYLRRIQDPEHRAVFFHGSYDNDRVATILADLDVLVVPSLWYENSPLTIQEAFIAGLPVITANTGGMAELVRDGIEGLHFKLGDAASLQQTMRRVIEHPEMLNDFRARIPPVPDIDRHAEEVLALYRSLVPRNEP